MLIASPEHWHAQMAEDAIARGQGRLSRKADDAAAADALRAARRSCAANPDAHPHRRHPVSCMTPELRRGAGADRAGRDRQAGLEPDELLPELEGRRVALLRDRSGVAAGREPRLEAVVRTARQGRLGSGGVCALAPLPEVLDRHHRRPAGAPHHAAHLALDAGLAGARRRASGGHYVDKAMENHDQVNLTIEFEHEHTMIVAGSTCNEVGLETRDPRPQGQPLRRRPQRDAAARADLRRRDRRTRRSRAGAIGDDQDELRRQLARSDPQPPEASEPRRAGNEGDGDRRSGHAFALGQDRRSSTTR